MVRFGEKEITKEKIYAAKKPIKLSDVDVDNIVVSKLVEAKTNSKYLIRIKFDKGIMQLILTIHKVNGYIKIIKVEDKVNKSMSFCMDDEKLSEKYKAIWKKKLN